MRTGFGPYIYKAGFLQGFTSSQDTDLCSTGVLASLPVRNFDRAGLTGGSAEDRNQTMNDSLRDGVAREDFGMDQNGILRELFRLYEHFEQGLLQFLPHLIGGLLTLFIGFLIAYGGRVILTRLLGRAHLLIPKGSIRTRVKGYVEEKRISRVIGGISFWILILFFLTIATEVMGLPLATMWLGAVTTFLPKILSASLIGVAGIITGVILHDIIVASAASAGFAHGRALGRIVKVATILVTMFISFDQLGIDVSFLENLLIAIVTTLLFAAALAFGLGARSSVGNILSSYYLKKTYKVGDEVRIGDTSGTVVELTPNAVILESTVGQVYIPAHEFNRRYSIRLPREQVS